MHHFFFILFLLITPAHLLFSFEELNAEKLIESCKKIESEKHFRLVKNALTQIPSQQFAKNWDTIHQIDFCFSHELSPSFPATDQQASGRCWLFAALNTLRFDIGRKIDVSDFEFSQSYLFFFDKIEKSNFFLENIIHFYDKPLFDNTIKHLFEIAITDGGDWHTFVNLTKKYGLVPKNIYPENEACRSSSGMNIIINKKLRQTASQIRNLLQNGGEKKQAIAIKRKAIKQIYQILVAHMGAPPSKFNCNYYDKNNKLHTLKNLTPHSIKEYIDYPYDDYIILSSYPCKNTPFYERYKTTLSSLMIGGDDHETINLPIEDFKEIAKHMIIKNLPIYFGADIRQQADFDRGVLDSNLYNYEELYQIDLLMPKEDRLTYQETVPCHAMVFTGMHMEDDKPIKWKVENSWGKEIGKNGIFVMSDQWFDDYVIQIVIPKKELPEKFTYLLNKKPIELTPYNSLFIKK